jgi:predicted DNA-binding transcriptional regulator AlpA
MTRADLAKPGPAIRLREVSKLSGFGRQKLYADIDRGLLAAHQVQCGRLWYWYVHRRDALTYLREYARLAS